MPRFSKLEKEKIREQLLKVGEELFVRYGIKKVTIDELARASGIAAGSFYAFFDSKESLYLQLNITAQNRIFNEIDFKNEYPKHLNSKEFTIQVLKQIIEKFMSEPILTILNTETWEHITRKVPPEMLKEHLGQDISMINMLVKSGVQLNYSKELTAKVFQGIFILVSETAKISFDEEAFDIMLEGILNHILSD